MFEIIGTEYNKEKQYDFSILRFPHILDRNAEKYPPSYKVLYELFAHGVACVPYEIPCKKDKDFNVICVEDAVKAVVNYILNL